MKFLSELSKETLICSELQVRDYKSILKCSYGDEVNPRIFAETICDIFMKLTNKSTEYFKKLNAIDLFCLLLDTRINSQGNICKVLVTKDSKQMTLELNLEHIKTDIKSIYNNLFTTIDQNNIEIVFGCPSVERLLQPTQNEYLSFITGTYIKQNDTKKFIEIATNEQAELLFDKISPKTFLKIIDNFNKFVETATKTNLLSRYGVKDQQLVFVPSLNSLIWFTKLMFNEPLETFYDNLFYLSLHGHMSSEYVENCVVGEYNYFVNCLLRTQSAKDSGEKQDDGSFFDEEAGLSDE